MALPTEMVYTSSQNCSNTDQLRSLSATFNAEVISTLRTQSFCASSPGACAVFDLSAECRYQERPSLPSARTRRYVVLAAVNDSDAEQPEATTANEGMRIGGGSGGEEDVYESAFIPDFDRYSSSLGHRRHRKHGSSSRNAHHDFVIAVKFSFRTEVLRISGDWPEEYHAAATRLNRAFEYLEAELMSGRFEIEDATELEVSEVRNSLAFKKEVAECGYRYMFDDGILLCSEYIQRFHGLSFRLE